MFIPRACRCYAEQDGASDNGVTRSSEETECRVETRSEEDASSNLGVTDPMFSLIAR